MISKKTLNTRDGFALVEILIALVILSTILLRVYSVVSTSINALSRVKNNIIAMMVAQNELNEFLLEKMRSLDAKDEPVKEYPGFLASRETAKLDLGLGPLEINKTVVTVHWKESGVQKSYKLVYIFENK